MKILEVEVRQATCELCEVSARRNFYAQRIGHDALDSKGPIDNDSSNRNITALRGKLQELADRVGSVQERPLRESARDSGNRCDWPVP